MMSQLETELGPVVGHVQTDTFCESCGYNLHTQAVVRDQRLGLLVCRCPECGRFSAAGRATSASRVWLNRFDTGLLIAWILFLLALFSLCSLFLGLVAYGHVMQDVRFESFQRPVPNRPGQSYPMMRYTLRDAQLSGIENDIEWQRREQLERALLVGITALLGLLAGGLFSVLLWHVKGWRRALALLPAFVGCGWSAVVWSNDPMTVWVRDWGLRRMGLVCLGECVAIVVGVYLGRPVARGLLHILLSPKLRQHLAFLWTVDGKRLAMMSTRAEAQIPA